MTSKKHDKDPTSINSSVVKRSTFLANLITTIPLIIVYTNLFLINYYLSPSGPGACHREGDEGRIQPLAIILMLLGPDIIQNTFAVTTAFAPNESPCFSFGWLAYSTSLLVSAMSESGGLLPREECGVKVVDTNGNMARRGKKRKVRVWRLLRDLESRYDSDTIDSNIVIEVLEPTSQPWTPKSFWAMIQNRSMSTGIFQFWLAGIFWYFYGDLSILLLLSTSILLLAATANLPIWSAQKHLSHTDDMEDGVYALMRDTGTPPQRIFIIQSIHPGIFVNKDGTATYAVRHTSVPAFILISGGFLCQALLCTQLSDAAAIVLLIIMFCGTISNVATASLPREPMVDGVKLHSVDTIGGGKSVVEALREVEGRYEGFGQVLLREWFPENIRGWKHRNEKGNLGEVGEMD